MGSGSVAVSGFDAGGTAAATRAVADVRGEVIFAIVASTVRIFFVGSLPFFSL